MMLSLELQRLVESSILQGEAEGNSPAQAWRGVC